LKNKKIPYCRNNSKIKYQNRRKRQNWYPHQANTRQLNILAWYRHWLYTKGLFLTTECTSIKWVWIYELKGNNTRRYQTTVFTVPVRKRCRYLSRQRKNGWYPL